MIVIGAPTIIRESWGSVNTFEFGHQKWVKRPLTYPMVFAENPVNFLLNTPKKSPKFCFIWAQEFQIPKMDIFRRCLEIKGKARYSLRET